MNEALSPLKVSRLRGARFPGTNAELSPLLFETRESWKPLGLSRNDSPGTRREARTEMPRWRFFRWLSSRQPGLFEVSEW